MELQKGLVSLLVPCYNGEEYVNRCVDSILAQTYPSIELILVNDGSTDHSHEAIMRRKAELDAKLASFKYVQLVQNIGPGGG